MIRFFILLSLALSLFASTVQRDRIQNGETYLVFLNNRGLPTKDLYYNLAKDDQDLTEEIRAGIYYQILEDENGVIEQVLLPLNDELQIHIYKIKNSYKFEIIPIIASVRKEMFATTITSSPLYNIKKATGRWDLASIFISGFKKSLNFKKDIQPGDRIAMVYEQKYRLGHPFSMPTLLGAMVETHHKPHYIFKNSDDRYYDDKGHEIEGFLLAKPVNYVRISSPFTKRRWHPILHKWKAHLGIDYAARSGTPVRAAGDGTIIYAGWAGGYGNLLKIRHADGYETRYGHLKSFRRGIKKGKYVKKGQVVAYVGTTGRSTGPHLHFELRKKGIAINPASVVQITTKKLSGKKYRQFIKLKKEYKADIQTALESTQPIKKYGPFQNMCYIHLLKKRPNV